MAHRGLAEADLLGGALDTALPHDCVEDNKQVQVESAPVHGVHVPVTRMHFPHGRSTAKSAAVRKGPGKSEKRQTCVATLAPPWPLRCLLRVGSTLPPPGPWRRSTTASLARPRWTRQLQRLPHQTAGTARPASRSSSVMTATVTP